MKKTIIAASLTVLTGGLLLPSCSKKIDEAYQNPNAPVKPPVEELMPTVVASMANHFTSSTTNFGPMQDGQYVGRYVQFWATNTSLNQYDMMGMTTTNSAAAASDIGGSQWAMHYAAMGQNLNRIVEWASEEKKWDYVGACYAMRAFGWLAVTDMHGEVIVKEAFRSDQLTFNYDTQEDAYEEVKKNVRLAIEYLDRTGDGVSEANLEKGAFYCSMKGNREKWKKFAYAIMARVFHRTTNKASYQADSVIHYANLAMSDNADNAYILFANLGGNSPTKSFYGPFRGNIGSFRQTRFAADLLTGVVSPTVVTPTPAAFPGVFDPRTPYLLVENPAGTYKGIRPAKGLPDGLVTTPAAADEQPFNFWGSAGTTGSDANARYIYRDGMPWPIATAAEMDFLKAEAYFRKGDKSAARSAYINGISKNFDMLTNVYNANVPVAKQITPTAKANYLANTLVVPNVDNLTLTHIMLQKYIALFGFGFMEVWADMRRYHYVDLDPLTGYQVYRNFEPPSVTGNLFPNNNGKLIYRVRPRFNSEYRWNLAAITAIGGAALDYHTKEQWFSLP